MTWLLLLLVLSGQSVEQQRISADTTTAAVVVTGPTKRCAFGLSSQVVLWGIARKPPTPKEMFDSSSGFGGNGINNAVVRHRASCPYERAIELFGEDRVEFVEGEDLPAGMACNGCCGGYSRDGKGVRQHDQTGAGRW